MLNSGQSPSTMISLLQFEEAGFFLELPKQTKVILQSVIYMITSYKARVWRGVILYDGKFPFIEMFCMSP